MWLDSEGGDRIENEQLNFVQITHLCSSTLRILWRLSAIRLDTS